MLYCSALDGIGTALSFCLAQRSFMRRVRFLEVFAKMYE